MLRQIYRCAALALLAAVLAGCGGDGGDDKPSSSAGLFDYDESKPLSVERKPTSLGFNDVRVSEVSFQGPGDTRLNGYLMTPLVVGGGRHPAVVYAHGARGDRQELVDEATEMARTGAITLTLDMIYSPVRAKPLPQGIEGVRANSNLEVECVREVRRAIDFLRSLDSVDGDHIGYVGWSQGARMGAIIAGVDHRIEAFDLIAGGAAPISSYVQSAPPDLRAELREILVKTDPMRFVAKAAPSELLFQLGRSDEVVPRDALEALARAGSKPKEIRRYDSGHVPSPQAWADSRRWLNDHLD